MNYIELDEVDSTNEYVKRNIDKLPDSTAKKKLAKLTKVLLKRTN